MMKEQAKAAIERAEKLRAAQARAQKKWRDKIKADEQAARALLGLPFQAPKKPAGRPVEKFIVVSHETGNLYEGNGGILVSIFSSARAVSVRRALKDRQDQFPADPSQWFVDEVNSAGKTLRVTFAENKDNVFSLTETPESGKL